MVLFMNTALVCDRPQTSENLKKHNFLIYYLKSYLDVVFGFFIFTYHNYDF